MMKKLVKEINKGKEAEEIVVTETIKIIRVNGFDVTVSVTENHMDLWVIHGPYGKPVTDISCIFSYAAGIPGMYENVPENLLMFVLSELSR